MKKLIAILMVLTLVVGFAFATTTNELHKLKIKSVVGEILPVFQLQYAGETTNSGTVKFSATTYTTNYTEQTALDSGFDIGQATTELAVSFECHLVADDAGNLAKTEKSFTITFSDGVFAVSRKGVTQGETLEPDSIECEAELPGDTGIASITVDDTVKAKTTVVFNGETVSDAQLLTTATYTYTSDPTIDMGTYYADIVVTITNES